MIDRGDLRDGVGAGGVVEGDGHDQGGALADLHQARIDKSGEESDRRGERVHRPGQRPVATGAGEEARGVDRIRIIADAIRIAAGARNRVVVQQHVSVRTGDRHGICDTDDERCRLRVAVTVGRRVGEGVGHTAGRARIACVAVAAIGVEGQLAELAGGGPADRARAAEASDRGDREAAVGACRVGHAVEGIGISAGDVDAGENIAGGRAVGALGDRIGVVRQDRPVVEEPDLVGDVDIRACRVSVAVGDRDAGQQRAVRQLEQVVRVGVRGMVEREILLDGDGAGGRVDLDGERGRACEQSAVDDASNDRRADLDERDRRAVGHRKARRGWANLQLILNGSDRRGSIRSEGNRRIDNAADIDGAGNGAGATDIRVVAGQDRAEIDRGCRATWGGLVERGEAGAGLNKGQCRRVVIDGDNDRAGCVRPVAVRIDDADEGAKVDDDIVLGACHGMVERRLQREGPLSGRGVELEGENFDEPGKGMQRVASDDVGEGDGSRLEPERLDRRIGGGV